MRIGLASEVVIAIPRAAPAPTDETGAKHKTNNITSNRTRLNLFSLVDCAQHVPQKSPLDKVEHAKGSFVSQGLGNFNNTTPGCTGQSVADS